MPSLLIESAKILVNNELTTANLFIVDGIINKITKLKANIQTENRIDARGLLALPGLIDAHVHLRDMDLSYKETFETGTKAAAAGGFTTVIEMPNTRPPTISATALVDKIGHARNQIYTNIAFQAALVDDQMEMQKMKEQGAVAFKLFLNKSLETFNSSDETELRRALSAAKSLDGLVTVHAEDGHAIKQIQERSIALGRTSVNSFLRAHAPRMEVSAVKTILAISTKLNLRVHICHITTAQAVQLVRKSKNATCEATAHHLLLDHSSFKKYGTMAICVPPIRSSESRRQLWSQFVKGRVDILASDHAPHTLEEKKNRNAWKAATGVPGLETSLPVMLTQVWNGKLSLNRLIEAAATLPAKIFGLKGKGRLREGYDADIVLVNPKTKKIIRPRLFLSKAKFSPFEGMHCRGEVVCTIVNGNVVFEHGKIVGPPTGRVVRSDT
ncbi:MAG: dihydroorotase family protein [Candidatus Bathyarchaeia archaeon]|jgi:dihydroorotase/allantoinase